MNLFAFLSKTPRLVMEGDMASLDVSQLLASTTSLRTALEYQQANGGALDPETRDGLHSEIVGWVNVLEDVNSLRVPSNEDAGRRLIDEGHAHCGRYASSLGGITHHLDLAATTMDPEMSSWAVRELSTHRYSLQGHRMEFERWVSDIKASTATEIRTVQFDLPADQSNAHAHDLSSWSDPAHPQDGSTSFQTQDGTWFQPEAGGQYQDPNQALGYSQPQAESFAQYDANDRDSNAFLPDDDEFQDVGHVQESTHIQEEVQTQDTVAPQEVPSIPEDTPAQFEAVANDAVNVPEAVTNPEPQTLHAKLAEKLRIIEAGIEAMAAHLNTIGTPNMTGPELEQARELLVKAADQSRTDLREFSDDFAKLEPPTPEESKTKPEVDKTMDDGTPTEAKNTNQDTFVDAITSDEIPAQATRDKPEMIDNSTQTEATLETNYSGTEKQNVPEFQDAVVINVNSEGMPTFETGGSYDMGQYGDNSQTRPDDNDLFFEENAETREDGTRIVEFYPASELNDAEDPSPRVYDDFYAVVVDEPPVECEFRSPVAMIFLTRAVEVKPEPEMTANGTQTLENTLESQLDESLKREKDVFNFMYPPVEALNGEMQSIDNSTQTADLKSTPEPPTSIPMSSPSPAPSSATTPATTLASADPKPAPVVRPPSYIGLDSTSKAIIEKDTFHITKVFNKIVAGGFNKLGLSLGVVNVEGEDWVPQFCEDHRFLNGVLMAITQPKRIFLWNVRNFPVDSDSWAKGSLVRTISIVTDPPRYLHSFPFRHRRNVRSEAPKLLLHWNIENFSEKAISTRFKDLIQAGGQLQQKIGSFSYKQMVVCITIPWTICKAQVNGENSEDQQKALDFLGRMGILSSIPVEGRIDNEIREGAWCPSSVKIGGAEQSVHAFLQEITYSGSPEMEPQMPSTPTRIVVVTMRKGESSDWVDAVHCSLGMNYHSLRYPVSTDEPIDYSQLRKYYRSAATPAPSTASKSV